jgi:hypothetical protein
MLKDYIFFSIAHGFERFIILFTSNHKFINKRKCNLFIKRRKLSTHHEILVIVMPPKHVSWFLELQLSWVGAKNAL